MLDLVNTVNQAASINLEYKEILLVVIAASLMETNDVLREIKEQLRT